MALDVERVRRRKQAEAGALSGLKPCRAFVGQDKDLTHSKGFSIGEVSILA
jgi:hypothetical protein